MLRATLSKGIQIQKHYISDYGGKKRIDIRIWYKDDDDELKPSKQGISLPIERFKDLKKLITDLEDALKEKKLL